MRCIAAIFCTQDTPQCDNSARNHIHGLRETTNNGKFSPSWTGAPHLAWHGGSDHCAQLWETVSVWQPGFCRWHAPVNPSACCALVDARKTIIIVNCLTHHSDRACWAVHKHLQQQRLPASCNQLECGAAAAHSGRDTCNTAFIFAPISNRRHHGIRQTWQPAVHSHCCA